MSLYHANDGSAKMTVKRYSKDGYHAEHKEGPFVAFEDYAKLQERVEKLEAALRAIIDEYESPQGCVIDGATMGRIAKEILEDLLKWIFLMLYYAT